MPGRDVGDDIVPHNYTVRGAPELHDGDGGLVHAEAVMDLIALDDNILIRAVRRDALHHDAARVVVVAIPGDVVLADR